MRTVVLVVLTMLMTPSLAVAHLCHHPHPKLAQHKHDHKMKQAAKQCCQDQDGQHHNLLHHGHKHH